MDKKFLTSEEVLAKAKTLKLDLLDRKLKYYVTLGIVPKPIRNPDMSADGRIAYYPYSVMERLSKIKELQDSGFTLPQIKKYFENSIDDRLESLLNTPTKKTDAEFPVEKIIAALSGDNIRIAFDRFQKQISVDSSNQTLLNNAAREYYVELISLMIGKDRADEYVKRFFDDISDEERNKKTELLKKNAEGLISSGKSSSLSVVISSFCKKMQLGNFDDVKILDELKDLADKIYILQDKYRASNESLKVFFDVGKFMRRPFWLYFKSLLELESFVADREQSHLDKALFMSVKADEMLDSIEDLVQRTKKLLELFQKSEKI